MPFIVTNNTKLQWLQYRINHRILATNSFLFKIKVVENPYCTFCHEELETIEHLLWNCEITQNFIEDIENWFLTNGISIPFTRINFIFGDCSMAVKGNVINLIFLRIKQYIYTTRYLKKKLSITAVQKIVRDLYILEKSIAIRNKKLEYFNNSWNIITSVL